MLKKVILNTRKNKKPWPTKKAMEQVYELKLWGDNNTDFYSGKGSHDIELVTPYLTVLTSFLKSFKTPISVCDLGCGDFNVGKQLVEYSRNYIAIDIVENLINHNKNTFKKGNLEFKALNIATDVLPSADCALVRQVLQHLSNDEIASVVTKLASFKYVILTEHLPEGEFTPNKDIISGQGIRLKKQSGVDILAAPFNFKVKKETQLLAIPLKDYKGILVTTLYQVF